MKTPTEFHQNYFSEETDPKFNQSFKPSPAVQELGVYLTDFIAKLKNTMVQSKAKHFSYSMADLDTQSFDIAESLAHVRHQVTLCTLDLLSNLFLASEQELKVRYGAAMQA